MYFLSSVKFGKEEQDIDIEFEEVGPSRNPIERIGSYRRLNQLRRIDLVVYGGREDFYQTGGTCQDSGSTGNSQLSRYFGVHDDTLGRERSSRQLRCWVDECIREEAVSLDGVLVGRSNSVTVSIKCNNKQDHLGIDLNWNDLRVDILCINHDFVEKVFGTKSESVARSIGNDRGNKRSGAEKGTSESDNWTRKED